MSDKKWFEYNDMHSGGGTKTGYEYIYVLAVSEGASSVIFENELNVDPYNMTCDCCGYDFSINEVEQLPEHITEKMLVIK